MKKILINGLAAGTVMLVVSLVFGQIVGALLPSLGAEYQNPGLFRPWSDPLMSLYFVYPFVLGIALAWAWGKTKQLLKEKDFLKRVANFGLAFFAVATIPAMLISYSSFPISLAMVLSWTVGSLLQLLGAGLVFAKLNP